MSLLLHSPGQSKPQGQSRWTLSLEGRSGKESVTIFNYPCGLIPSTYVLPLFSPPLLNIPSQHSHIIVFQVGPRAGLAYIWIPNLSYLWASASYYTSLCLNLFNHKLGDGGQGGYKSYVIGLLWELNEWIQSAGTLFGFSKCFISVICSLWLQLVKNPPAMRETWVWSLGWEDPLEKGKATHSSILAWRIPWGPWTIQSMGSQRIGYNWATFTYCWQLVDLIFLSWRRTQRSQAGSGV